jgi:TatA/E family protein of Tat protein translocase
MLSAPHLILLFLVALLVFGPEKLPELARNLSKWMNEFRRFSGDFQETIQREMSQLERDALDRERLRSALPATAAASASSAPATVSQADEPSAEGASSAEFVEGDETEASETEEPDAGDASTENFESYRYDDPYAYAETAEGYQDEWQDESSTAGSAESAEPAPEAETLPAGHPPDDVTASTEEKSPVGTGAEQPIDDHPSAA